jgi:hypothetical protein
MCATFGYSLEHKKFNQDFMVQMQILHSFILLFFLLSICYQNDKIMAKGIADIGAIMM